MSQIISSSEDETHLKDQTESPLVDEGNEGDEGGGIVLKKGPWTSAEDAILVDYVQKHGEGNWNAVQKHSGLFRCGKSCRLRWANHLRPNLKKGAFTAEEEQMIIELHAKMGNKWARMAAQLPGRTDNEIKNYWNTRIKRRQRAGLPLYPPDVCLQASQASQQGRDTGTSSRETGPYDLMQTNNYGIPDIVLDHFKANPGVIPYLPEFSSIPSSNVLIKGFRSPEYCSFMPPATDRQKRIRQSMASFPGSDGTFDVFLGDPCNEMAQSFGSLFPLDHDPTIENVLSFGTMPGSQPVSNGISSASEPCTGVEKLELPSLQYAETDLGSWGNSPPSPIFESVDAFIQSPLSGLIDSDRPSSQNSGLLEDLVNEAKYMIFAKNHLSDKSSISSSVTAGDIADISNLNVCETDWEDYAEPISPFGHSTTSHQSRSTPISAHGNSFECLPADSFQGSIVKSESFDQVWTPDEEKEFRSEFNFSRPDALLASDWVEESYGLVKDRANMTNAIAMLRGDNLPPQYRKMAVGTSTPARGLTIS